MKNTLQRVMQGITGLRIVIVLVAVIGFSMMGCEQPTEPPTLTGITADYTGGSVAINTDINSLKSNLTVTAKYSDNTSKTLNDADYSLSGDLSSSGQKTVTVTYTEDGITKTDTFNVTVTAAQNSDITYTVARADGEDGVTNTTGIVFTFSASVTGLTADDITITDGNGSVTKGTLSGSGTSWTLGVTVITPGNVTVAIDKSGIEAGTKNVTVYKAGQTAPTLTGITLDASAVEKNYTQNETLDLTGLVVTANYNDSPSATVTGYTSSPANGAVLSATGQITVTVSYTEGEVTKTASFIVNVTAATTAKTLTGITLDSSAVEKDYTQNETLDLTGLIVTANYSDGTSAAVSYTSTSPANGTSLDTAGIITVTVTYTDGTITRSNTFTITVTAVNTGTEGLAYELIDNGTAYRVRKGTVTGGAVVIPATYEGLPVTEIGSVDDSYDNGAFRDCTGLTSITIPASVTSISVRAFSNCSNLTSITVDNDNPNYTSQDGILYNKAKTEIELIPRAISGTVTIPASVTSIGEWAFSGCTSLTSVTIGESVTEIGNYAFRDCTGLTSLTLPVTTIGEWAFSSCNNIETVTFIDGSSTTIGSWFRGFSSITTVNIPASVTSIDDLAFDWCTGLNSITIPSSVTYIGSGAFYNCTGLTSITLPASVTSIGIAFQNWTNAQTIYVEGFTNQAATDAAWGNYWRSDCNAVIVYGVVSEIEITQQPAKTVYLIGDQLDITGLVVTARFNDNTTRTVPITAANITGFDSTTAGVKNLTVTVGSKTATFTVTVAEQLSSIAVTRQPNIMTYIIGEQLDITGIVVTATYSNGATGTVTVTAADITGFDSSTLGTKTLTVTYNGKTAMFTISVVDPMVVTNTTEWNNAITTLNGQTGSYIINIGGSFNVAGSTANTFGTTADGSTLTVRLIGNGTLSLTSSNSYILRAGANQTIIIDSENLILNAGNVSNSSSLISVDGSSAKLELKNGTISGNYRLSQESYGVTARAYGGGVYVGASGTFIMSGGTISGNTVEASSSQSADVYAYGGGVYNVGTFIMTGGTISGNQTRAAGGYAYTYGGGVYNAGTFRIVNGTIYGSNANPSSLSNTLYINAYYPRDKLGAALYGTAQRGTFSGETWVSAGTVSTTDYTIRVVNGALQ